MDKYIDQGKIFDTPYAIEVNVLSESGSIKKNHVGNQGILQKPFNDFYRLAESIDFSHLEAETKLIVKINGPAYFFYFFLKKICWYFDISNIEFQCTFQNKQDADLMISKMNDFVLAVTSKNLFQYEYLFCKNCQTPKKYYPIEMESGIDFVIPVKNTPINELLVCLQSIESQIEASDRVYVIDDNDSPTLKNEMLGQIDFKVEIIRGNVEGIGAARNMGVRSGSNPLVLFIDSDDYILPGFVSKQRAFHKKHFEVGATGTWLQAFGSHNRFYPQWDNISPLSILSCLPPAGVLLWKRKALDELNYFNSNYRTGFEDFDLVARATVRGIPIIVLDEVLYRYRRGHNSLSQSWDSSQEWELRNAVNSHLKDLCHHEFKSFLELNSRFGPSIFQANPDFVFVKQELKFRGLRPSLFVIFYLLPKKWRKSVLHFIVKFFPILSRYIPDGYEVSRKFMQMRHNRWLSRYWSRFPNKLKYFLFRRYFS